MTEKRKYFEIEIGDVIKFYAGRDECEYPLTSQYGSVSKSIVRCVTWNL